MRILKKKPPHFLIQYTICPQIKIDPWVGEYLQKKNPCEAIKCDIFHYFNGAQGGTRLKFQLRLSYVATQES